MVRTCLSPDPRQFSRPKLRPGDEGLQLSLFFAGREGKPRADASQKVFRAFLEEVIAAATADPQPTLWETNARIRPRPANQRLKLFLDDVFRLRDVEIEACGRRVRISDSRIDIAQQ